MSILVDDKQRNNMTKTNNLEDKRLELEEKIIDMWISKHITNERKEVFLQIISEADIDDLLEFERTLTKPGGLMDQFDVFDEFNRKFIKRTEDFEDTDLFTKDYRETKKSLVKKGFIELSSYTDDARLAREYFTKDVYDLTDNEFLVFNKILMRPSDDMVLCKG